MAIPDNQAPWARGAGITAAVTGAIVLAGWVASNPLATGAARGLPPIAPLTAIGFITAGLALLALAALPRTNSRVAGAALAGLCALASVLAFFTQGSPVPMELRTEAVTGWMERPRVLLHLAPTIATAGALLLLAISLLALALPRRGAGRIAQTAALAPLLVALFTAMPIASAEAPVPSDFPTGAIPAHVAWVILLLSVGVILVRADKGAPWGLPLRAGSARMIRGLLPLVVLIPTAFGWLGRGLVFPRSPSADRHLALLVVAEVVLLLAFCASLVRRQQIRESRQPRRASPPVRGATSAQLPAPGNREYDNETHRRQLDQILRLLPAPFLVLDAGGRIGFANPEADYFFRQSRGGLPGLWLRDVIGDSEWARLLPVLDEVRATGAQTNVKAELDPGARLVELRVFPADEGVALFIRELGASLTLHPGAESARDRQG